MHLITEDPTKGKDLSKIQGSPAPKKSSPAQALKNKIIDKTSDVLSAPARAYYGIKSGITKAKYNHVVGDRNFQNRKDNTNYYKGTNYWSKNKN